MTFSSITFFVFFILVYLVILMFNNRVIRERMTENCQLTLKHSILLISSYIFYGWWDYRFCFLMMLLTLVAWFCAKQIDADKNKKAFTVIGVSFPLIILMFFKYFNFLLIHLII